jgi:hypothetical protein
VRTIVGHDLFVFGDRDGDRETARLQHPVGMAYGDGALWVADTYNGKLRRIDPASGTTSTVPSVAPLAEPGGVSVAGGAIWIADTNRHRVLRAPLRGGAPAPIAMAGLAPPSPRERPIAIDSADPVVTLGPLKIAPGRASPVEVRWELPAGTEVNAEAPVKLQWVRMRGLRELPAAVKAQGGEAQHGLTFSVAPALGATSAELVGVLQLVTCDAAHARVCLPVRRTVEASFAVDAAAGAAAAILPLPAAR